MKLFAPDWFSDFRCIADKCSHSCCIGWEIDIDPETFEKYQKMTGEWKKRFDESIIENDETICFRLTQEERCPFLNEQGLCDIILAHGEEALSQICTDHPRFRSFFSDRTEIGLGMCCEEAARLIISHEQTVRLTEISDDGFSETQDEEETAFFKWREKLFAIIQDRSLPLTERLQKLCHACGFSWNICHPADWMQFLLSLERLDAEWEPILAGMQNETQQWEIAFEQLLFYLLYRHLPGALEDGRYPERVAFCVLLLRVIRSLPCDSMEKLVELCRMASSEIEYSDENTERILEKLEKTLQQQYG